MTSNKSISQCSSKTSSSNDQEFTNACKDLILLSANGSLTEDDSVMIELMASCSKYFLQKMVIESARNAQTNEINYDDIADLVHSEPWLGVFRESFRKRISLEEIISRRKRTMKNLWFFDYTHFNKLNKSEDQEANSSKISNKNKLMEIEKVEKPVVLQEFSSKKRKIIPKKHLYE